MFKTHTISVIIANYNWGKNTERLLNSIYQSDYPRYDVVFVDDASADDSVKIAKKFPCKVIELKENRGPAYARNMGVKKSRGEIIVFVDADTEMPKNLFQQLNKDFNDDDIIAVIGSFDKEALNKGIVPAYLALETHYMWKIKKLKYTKYFHTTLGAIRRDVFEKTGGFDEKYKKADVEDIEFGYRLPKDKKILLDKNIVFKHYFSSFVGRFQKVFRRSSQWIKLGKLDETNVSFKNGLKTVVSLLFLVSLPLVFFNLGVVSSGLLVLFVTLDGGLFWFVLKEKGLFFATASIFFNYVFALAGAFGAVYGISKGVFTKWIF
jgi:GT2 family glycosyltransferase